MKLTVDQLQHFVGSVVVRQEAPMNQANVPLLVSNWTNFFNMGIGQAWGAEDASGPTAFLLALYTKDLITGLDNALCYLWMGKKGALDVFHEWENDPRTKAAPQQVAGFIEGIHPKAMARLYRKLGYAPHSQSVIKVK